MPRKKTEEPEVTYPGKRHIVPLILLILVSIIIFSNTFPNSFIWDDRDLIVENKYVKDLQYAPFLFSLQYWRYYHPGTKGLYCPVTTVSFALDYFFWKDNTSGYHLTNLLLHILNVILIYFLVHRLQEQNKNRKVQTARDSDRHSLLNLSFLAALFFAAHPIHTESVTWIKNRFDLLTLLFFLLSVLLFLRYAQQKPTGARILSYSAAFFCFVPALLSKGMAVTLPIILLLYTLCFVPPKKYGRTIIAVLPFFGVMILYLIFNMTALRIPLSGESASKIGLYSNILVVFKTIGYYVKLLVLPFGLNAERLLDIPRSFFEPAVLSSAVASILLLIIIIKTFKHSRLLFFAILWIFLTLLPVSNIVFLSGRPIAEQRLYIPSLGFCLILAMGIIRFSSLEPRTFSHNTVRNLTSLLSILIVAGYSATTMKRNLDWRDPITFWSKTLQSSPKSARAHNNLGVEYCEMGEKKEAMALYEKAIAINADFSDSYYNLANLYLDMGKPEETIALYEKTIKLKPYRADAYNNLGTAYEALGRKQEAVSLYKKAIKIDPDYAKSYVNLGLAYTALGRKQEAIPLYKKAIEINPYYEEAHNNLGFVYDALGMKEEAFLSYKTAVEIDPYYADAYYNIGILHAAVGKKEEAITMFRKAIQINTQHADAHYNLGILYKSMGKNEEAIDMFKRAMAIRPQADVYDNLGSIYKNTGSNEEAIDMFRKAIEIDANYAKAYNNLAMTYFDEKQYDLAAKYCEKALTLGLVNPTLLNALQPYIGKNGR